MAKVATALNLEELAALADKATTGPWYVGRFDDEHFMSAISIKATSQMKSAAKVARLSPQPLSSSLIMSCRAIANGKKMPA